MDEALFEKLLHALRMAVAAKPDDIYFQRTLRIYEAGGIWNLVMRAFPDADPERDALWFGDNNMRRCYISSEHPMGTGGFMEFSRIHRQSADMVPLGDPNDPLAYAYHFPVEHRVMVSLVWPKTEEIT